MAEVIPEYLLDGCCCPILLVGELASGTGSAEKYYKTDVPPSHYVTRWSWPEYASPFEFEDPYTEPTAFLDSVMAANPVTDAATWTAPESPIWIDFDYDHPYFQETRVYTASVPSCTSSTDAIRLHSNTGIKKLLLLVRKDVYVDYAVTTTTVEKRVVTFSDDAGNPGWTSSEWLVSDVPSYVDGEPQGIRYTILKALAATQ